MGKPLIKKLNTKDYFQKFTPAGISLVRVVLLTEAWEQAGKTKLPRRRALQDTTAIAENSMSIVVEGNGGQRDRDENTLATKSKGGRPKDSWSFDTDMLPYYYEFLKEEFKHRAATGTNPTQETNEQTEAWASWYNGAIQEILRVTEPAPVAASGTNINETTADETTQDKEAEYEEESARAMEDVLDQCFSVVPV